MSKYVFFWSGPFSNRTKVQFKYKGIEFASAEQAMMWEKAMVFGDIANATKILDTIDPARQKAIGHLIENYDDVVWSESRLGIVINILRHKFWQDADSYRALMATDDKILVEASPHDTIWGIGLSADNPLAQDESTWKGANLLGIALTTVRNEFKAKSSN